MDDDDNFVENFERPWQGQDGRAKQLTVVQRLQAVNEQIQAFENRYGGTFQDLFGNLSDLQIDRLPEAVDIDDWTELITERQRLTDMTLAMKKVTFIQANDFDEIFSDDACPSGVYAVPPDPNQPKIQVRRLYEFCRERGLSPSQLSESEMQQFMLYPIKDGEQDKKRE
ncbi:hypothetical protein [Alicyclobacillus mengziensis]|uniref:Uncharacterized protein n=1 Tax=Alicyclobacillus mengziensis TaxID=2931921 RepID=A0A9X7W1G5_9BACL|nr:hypothetical protein [Alicyclobacillus mengziensis]QSO48447.1 hypothetical protein JZ786_05515 [Alicyclobacillus mengziensis]